MKQLVMTPQKSKNGLILLDVQWADNDNPVMLQQEPDLFDIQFLFAVPKSNISRELNALMRNYFTIVNRYEHAELGLRTAYKVELTRIYLLLREEAETCRHF